MSIDGHRECAMGSRANGFSRKELHQIQIGGLAPNSSIIHRTRANGHRSGITVAMCGGI